MASKKISTIKYILKYDGIIHYLRMRCFSKKANQLLGTISDREFIEKKFLNIMGKKLNLDNPKTYSEKLQWLKLYWRDPLAEKCSDKIEVRKYIEELGFGEHLTKLYGEFNYIDEINFSLLPKSFVIKATHDSGGVFVVKNNEPSDILRAKQFINDRLQRPNYSKYSGEWVYENIKPRILIEELIKTQNGKTPNDYKFFCFHGEPKFLFVASNRDTDTRFDFFDLNWNRIPVANGYLNSDILPKKLPENILTEMINLSISLSKPFPHVRVDFYYENNKIYVGELTFFHWSGFKNFYPDSFDEVFGNFLDLKKI